MSRDDEEKKPVQGMGKAAHIASGSAGAIGGFIAAMLARRATSESPLPLQTFEWIIEHGVAGFSIVIAFVMSFVAWRVLRDKSRLEDKYAKKVEDLMREQVVIVKKTAKLLTLTVEVLRGAHVSFDEIEQADRDEDENENESRPAPVSPNPVK